MTCLSLTFAEAVARYGDRLAAGFDLLMDDSDGEARTCLLCARRMTAAWRVLLLTERQRWWFERPLCAACAARGWATCRGELVARIHIGLADRREGNAQLRGMDCYNPRPCREQ
jgi:hypothetical protein